MHAMESRVLLRTFCVILGLEAGEWPPSWAGMLPAMGSPPGFSLDWGPLEGLHLSPFCACPGDSKAGHTLRVCGCGGTLYREGLKVGQEMGPSALLF